MFETAVISNGPQTKRMWTTIMGFSGQAVLVTSLVLAPLISPASLPKVVWSTMTLAPPAPLPPPPGPISQVVPKLRAVARLNVFIAPVKVPPKVLPIDDLADAAPTNAFIVGAVPGTATGSGASGSVIGAILNSVGPPAPAYHAPVPVANVAPAPTKPARITTLQMAEPIQRVPPAYPALARSARISGTVELMGVLGTDGRLHEIKVLSGHPLLVKAAVDAVMQWVYRPTVLNGQPVEVQAPISVRFIMN